VQKVCQAIGSDSCIGPRFLNPGIGYGGSCFFKDLMVFRAVARSVATSSGCWTKSCASMRSSASASCVKSALRCGHCGENVWACWARLSRAAPTIIRKSPAILLVHALLQEGCLVAAYDPAASGRAREVLNSNSELVGDADAAAKGADALLLTKWDEFASPDLDRLHKALKYPS